MSESDEVREFLDARGCPDDVVEGGVEGLLAAWEKTAQQVERGYPLGLDDYLNDLDGRQLLEDVLKEVPEARTPDVADRLHRADARMRGAVRRVDECLWGSRVAEAEGWNADDEWWYFAIPRSPGAELSADLEDRD